MTTAGQPDRRRIVVIGPCASGKTTLTQRLKALGYDARACGQEHSQISELWKHSEPDVLIGLRIDLEALRIRRSPTWPANLYDTQQNRLASGYAHADLVIDADHRDADEVLERVLEYLRSTGTNSPGQDVSST